MVAAFLDMDRRQSVIEAGVAASYEFEPERHLLREWEPIRQACYRAGETYLELAVTDPDRPLAPAPAYEQALLQISEATRTLDEFFGNNRGHLEHMTAVANAVPELVHRIRTEAQDALAAVHAPDSVAYTHYPSVRSATENLEKALSTLDAAQGAGATRAAALRAEGATAALRTALNEAPRRRDEAARTLASVLTRLDAVRTRAEGLAPAFSALLREFNAASSADLSGNEKQARELLARADEQLRRARAAADDGRPEEALELVTAIRAELSRAEELVDAVTTRLATLRVVRQNPGAKVDEVRFRLRDAQHLAVQRGLTAEWGSVLDSQLSRIDRAVDALTGVHPDYWAYVRDLDAVSTFIAGVVDRMRGRTDSA
ncbi:hypothetical protein [Rhodococcus sp. CH91]|uniref:hypothetical protein n=1 Tax=Rhodococcus sp. CH91 TaxID=2910256 RepID=UPI001F4A35BA|nr:hypothetical protein [Rhodococcus sp. CH91]